jgi:nicotinamide-nucleotide amidase
MRPACAEPIENPNGTAPGLFCRPPSGKFVIALPGPKGEFVPMIEGPVRSFLSSLNTGQVIVSHILKTAGIGEAALEDEVRDLIRGGNPSVAPYAHPGEVHLRITASAKNKQEAESLIAPVESKLREILGDAVYGGKEETLESVIVHELCRRDEKLAVAESCTGGGLGDRITSVPGCSGTFVGGIISYANEIKEKQLGVSKQTLETKGAVSEECAREMAEGVCKALDANWGISITGIAGPDGGTAQKPVGLVYIGVAGPDETTVEEYRFRGGRESIRQRSVQMALIQIWKRLR